MDMLRPQSVATWTSTPVSSTATSAATTARLSEDTVRRCGTALRAGQGGAKSVATAAPQSDGTSGWFDRVLQEGREA